MTETKKRIKQYSKALPKLKERLIAVTLLMSMSLTMLATVSFAWVTLSANPEVSSVNTSIVSNGNLEIALAKGLYAPNESAAGDGNLPDLLRNNTWGNLINLSDAAYGLDKLVLRPAVLNKSNLIERPLYGPVYDENGHVIDVNTKFGYSKWDIENQRFSSTDEAMFQDNDDMYGVRAITSMKYGEVGDNVVAVSYNTRLDAIENLNANVQTHFNAIANVKEHQDALEALMTGYMIENQLKTNPSHGDKFPDAKIEKGALTKCVTMYEALVKVFEEEADVIAKLLSFQAEVNGVTGADGGFLTVTKEDILALEYNTSTKTAKKALTDRGFVAASGGVIDGIDQFIADYKILKEDVVRLGKLVDSFGTSTSILWKDSMKCEDGTTLVIDDIVNRLVNVKKCRIKPEGGSEVAIEGVGLSKAQELNGKHCTTYINNGALYNFHSLCGGALKTNDELTLEVTIVVIFTINGKIYSTVETNSTANYFDVERAAVAKAIMDKHGKPPYIAKDTYGFAIDFWVRTNAANTYLTLEGNVLTETKQEQVMGKDANGNEVEIHTITVKIKTEEDESAESGSGGILDDVAPTQSFDVYTAEGKDENGNSVGMKWYFAEGHFEVTKESLGLTEEEEIPTPIKKIKDVEYVIGYEGENRIWNGAEHSSLSVDSSTQGSGSCYVFYAESPDDQARSLSLMKYMKVAFINDKGELLAEAFMDSDRHYADSGKVIVPLVLTDESVNIGNDINGNPMRAITALEQNVATRITAIVYLDGELITNEHVLASADIRGKINIQFGSSVALYPLMNEELYSAELVATFNSFSKTEFDYDTLADGDKMETLVKVYIEGNQPKKVIANFVRRINATQGSPEKSFTLTDTDGDGIWEGTAEFLYPGTYILRSVYMDGVEKELRYSTSEDPTVTVKGFTLSTISQLDKQFVMTDDNAHVENINITFASNNPDKMPKTVLGKFTRKSDGATVNVNFAYDPTSTSWNGSATFAASGEYIMQFLLLDGQYYELPELQQREIELILGMRVHVETDSPTTMVYGDPTTPEHLEVKVKILDNNGDVIPGLANVDLYYGMSGTEPLHAKLNWDTVEYYKGEFPTHAGTWNFNRVVVKRGENVNTLTRVNDDAPIFTVIPPTPPSFVSTSTESKSWFLENESDSGLVEVVLKEASSAVVIARVVDKDDSSNVHYISPEALPDGSYYYTTTGTENGVDVAYQHFLFAVPEDGLWELDAVSVFNVFDNNNTLHPLPEGGVNDEDAFKSGVIFDENTVDNYDAIEIAVLSKSNVEAEFDFSAASSVVHNSDKVVTLGKDANGNITSTFMQTVNVNNGGITIVFSDENDLISRGYFDIGQVKLEYKFGALDVKYGGYSRDGMVTGQSVGKFENFSSSDGVTFTLSNNTDINFQHAAKYVASALEFTVTSEYDPDINVDSSLNPEDAYAIEVWSKVPTVLISDITMDGQGAYSIDKFESGSIYDAVKSSGGCAGIGATNNYTTHSSHIFAANNTQYIPHIESGNLTAWLYFKCSHQDVATYSDNNFVNRKPHAYAYSSGNGVPAATLSLTDMGNVADSAYLAFTKEGGGDVIMITQYTADRSGGTYWGDHGTYGTDRYTWSKNTSNAAAVTCKRFIGVMDNGAGQNGSDSKTVAGTIKANTLVFVYGGQEYKFSIPTITINNPY